MFHLLPQLAGFLIAEGVSAFVGSLQEGEQASQNGPNFDALVEQMTQSDNASQGQEWLQFLDQIGLSKDEIQEVGKLLQQITGAQGKTPDFSQIKEVVVNFLDKKMQDLSQALPFESNLSDASTDAVLSQDQPLRQNVERLREVISQLQQADFSFEELSQLGKGIADENQELPLTDSALKPSAQQVSSTIQEIPNLGLNALQKAIIAPQAAASGKLIELNASIFQPAEWSDQFGEQISWLSNQQLKAASIKLNPPELGPMEVSIKMVQDQATVNINSHSVQVRDLIEQAIPRLKEMLEQQGLTLADVNVSDSSNQQSNEQQRSGYLQQIQNLSNQTIGDSLQGQAIITRLPQGLVDYFA